MKNLSFLLFLYCSILGHSQELLNMGWSFNSIINFEDTTENKYIDIDTSNIWQIVEPDKQILFIPPEHSYLGNYAIIGDTNNFYANNINSSFQFKLLFGDGDFYDIGFSQKYDFEENKDGGIIETSYDNGNTWQNILFDSIIQNNLVDAFNLYNSEDTISSFQNQPGFTGLQSNIESVIIQFDALESLRGDSMLRRFTISTDSVDNQNEGWMLDHFGFSGALRDGIESNNYGAKIDIYPNPVKNLLEIKTDNEITRVKIISLLGITLLEKEGLNIKSIDLTGIDTGIYLVICKGIEDNWWAYRIQKI